MASSAGQETLAAAAAAATAPYPPSWIDRLNDRISALPGPGWWPYLLIWFVLFLIETGLHWVVGTYPAGTFFPFHAVVAGLGLYFLGLTRYLDDVAARALATFRPALTADDALYERLRYQLTTLPARQTLRLNLTVLPLLLLPVLYVLNQPRFQLLQFGNNPYVVASTLTLIVFGGMVASGFAYHTVRQLGLVRLIYADYTRVNLLRLGPLYAFSQLTARTAAGIALAASAWLLSLPNVEQLPEAITAVIGYSLFAAAVFIVPLSGAHSLLAHERASLKAAAGEHLEIALAELHRRVAARELDKMVDLQAGIDALVKEREVLDKVPVWPWEPETVRLLGTAVLLPVVLWFVQRVLETVLHF